jgi:hypothetical protein
MPYAVVQGATTIAFVKCNRQNDMVLTQLLRVELLILLPQPGSECSMIMGTDKRQRATLLVSFYGLGWVLDEDRNFEISKFGKQAGAPDVDHGHLHQEYYAKTQQRRPFIIMPQQVLERTGRSVL